MFIYVCVHMYVQVHAYASINNRTQVLLCTCICNQVYASVYMCIHVNTYECHCKHVHACIQMPTMLVYDSVYLRMLMHIICVLSINSVCLCM